jgi:hypothetical protein
MFSQLTMPGRSIRKNLRKIGSDFAQTGTVGGG